MVTLERPRRGDVFLVHRDPTRGGGIRKSPPCVVVSPDEVNAHVRTVIVAPLSTGGHACPIRARPLVEISGRASQATGFDDVEAGVTVRVFVIAHASPGIVRIDSGIVSWHGCSIARRLARGCGRVLPTCAGAVALVGPRPHLLIGRRGATPAECGSARSRSNVVSSQQPLHEL